MSSVKQLKWNIILLGVAYVFLGVVLFLNPEKTQEVVSYALGVALIVVGIVNLIQYIRTEATAVVDRYDLVFGFSGVIGGILIIINVTKFETLVVLVLGFMVMISGVMKLQNSVNLMRLKSGSWHIPFGLALINIVYGVIMLIHPEWGDFYFILLGIGFIFSGITDIIVTIMVSYRVKKITEVVMGHTANNGAGGENANG